MNVRELQRELSRREFLRVAASAGAVGAGAVLLGGCGADDGSGSATSTPGIVIDPPPETTTIRLSQIAWPHTAPIFVAEQFLPAEGFTDVQYIGTFDNDQGLQQLAAGDIDVGLFFAAPLTVAVDQSDAVAVLAGVHSSSFEMFGNERVQSLRDLKGKKIAGKRNPTGPEYPFIASVLAYIGIDVEREVEMVEWFTALDFLQAWQAGRIEAALWTRPAATLMRNSQIGHVILDGMVDAPWSGYFGGMVAGNSEFVEKHPAATKRALRAVLKAADVCASEPERAARNLIDKGVSGVFSYDDVLDAITGASYAAWREFDPEDTVRFYALRLREAGLVKSTPDELIARATDWRYLDEIKRELGVA